MESDESSIYFSLLNWQNELGEPVYNDNGYQINDYVTIIDWRKI